VVVAALGTVVVVVVVDVVVVLLVVLGGRGAVVVVVERAGTVVRDGDVVVVVEGTVVVVVLDVELPQKKVQPWLVPAFPPTELASDCPVPSSMNVITSAEITKTTAIAPARIGHRTPKISRAPRRRPAPWWAPP
jgi:hypothetical protein